MKWNWSTGLAYVHFYSGDMCLLRRISSVGVGEKSSRNQVILFINLSKRGLEVVYRARFSSCTSYVRILRDSG